MILIEYQKYALENIIKHKKSFIFWTRQTGKSLIINKSIENFVMTNNNKKIFFIAEAKKYFSDFIRKIQKDIDPTAIIKCNSNSIKFINNNELILTSIRDINLDSLLFHYKPDFILYDGFREIKNNEKNLHSIVNYFDININCIGIFTFLFDIKIVKILDNKNDFYINIIPSIVEKRKIISSMDIIINFDILKILDYKRDGLLDYYDLKYIRSKKINKINKTNSI